MIFLRKVFDGLIIELRSPALEKKLLLGQLMEIIFLCVFVCVVSFVLAEKESVLFSAVDETKGTKSVISLINMSTVDRK